MLLALALARKMHWGPKEQQGHFVKDKSTCCVGGLGPENTDEDATGQTRPALPGEWTQGMAQPPGHPAQPRPARMSSLLGRIQQFRHGHPELSDQADLFRPLPCCSSVRQVSCRPAAPRFLIQFNSTPPPSPTCLLYLSTPTYQTHKQASPFPSPSCPR